MPCSVSPCEWTRETRPDCAALRAPRASSGGLPASEAYPSSLRLFLRAPRVCVADLFSLRDPRQIITSHDAQIACERVERRQVRFHLRYRVPLVSSRLMATNRTRPVQRLWRRTGRKAAAQESHRRNATAGGSCGLARVQVGPQIVSAHARDSLDGEDVMRRNAPPVVDGRPLKIERLGEFRGAANLGRR